MDTPGIHRTSKSLLNKTINLDAVAALEGVDAVVMIVEAMRWRMKMIWCYSALRMSLARCFWWQTRSIRSSRKKKLFGWLPGVLAKYPFKEIFPLSATKGTNTEQLKAALAKVMPQQDWIYAEDDVTDQSTRFICGELIREQLMTYLHQEMPYSTAVEIETFEEKPKLTEINAVIWVSRENQKGIVIGNRGDTLKRIGSSARIALEAFLERKVMLKLWVRVEENWENSPRHLQSLGISS